LGKLPVVAPDTVQPTRGTAQLSVTVGAMPDTGVADGATTVIFAGQVMTGGIVSVTVIEAPKVISVVSSGGEMVPVNASACVGLLPKSTVPDPSTLYVSVNNTAPGAAEEPLIPVLVQTNVNSPTAEESILKFDSVMSRAALVFVIETNSRLEGSHSIQN